MGEDVVDSVVALDDDPTGAQALAGIRVLLDWTPERVADALSGRRATHLLTNVRALPPDEVEAVVCSAAEAAASGVPDAHILLRGDSTLRGHLREELLGLRSVVDPDGVAPVLLVPALPAAGRITLGGVHLIERHGARTALHDTEYAKDGVFAYGDAHLLTWAEERSGGLLPAANGRELHLDELRSGGTDAVAAVLGELSAARRPAAFAPDAETEDDLRLIAKGYARAHATGARALVRCAPAFVGVLSGTTAPGLVDPPSPDGDVLVVCGSYVPTTTRQLGRLVEERPASLVEVDVLALASDEPGSEIQRAARALREHLDDGGFGIVATPRERPAETQNLAAGDRIADGLAHVVAALRPRPHVVLAKGGITSHVTLQVGLGADEAEVVGPVLPGVSRWRVETDEGDVDYLVAPGNVGDDELLVAVLDMVMRGSRPC